MKKVLIIGPDFFGYNESIARAFNKNEWYADVINYFDGRSMTFSQLVSSLFNKNYLFDINRIKLNVQYDLILIVKGTKLTNEKILELKTSTKKIFLWIMDPINLFPEVKNKISLFNNVFTFQKSDIEILHNENSDISYLPLFFDDEIFKLEKEKKEIDFIFIGNLYEQRAKDLEELCKSVFDSKKNLNIEIYGGFGFFKFINYIKIKNKYKHLAKYLKFGLISPKKSAQLYSKSKVGINIHVESQTGLNMRFFELYSSNVVQILPNKNIEFNNIDVSKEYFIFNNLNLDVLIKILNTKYKQLDMKTICKHSSRYRIKEMINEFNNEN